MNFFKKQPTYTVKSEVQVVMKNGSVLTTEFKLEGLKSPEEFDEQILDMLKSNGYFILKENNGGYKTLIPVENIERLLYNPKVTEIKSGDK